jgi:urease accessory protein UreF
MSRDALLALAAKWEADAAVLMLGAKAYRAQCHAAQRSIRIGKATALQSAAAQLRAEIGDAE